MPKWIIVALDGWYPRLINWLLREDLETLKGLAYLLHLWGVTTTVLWCSLVAGTTRILTKLRPDQRRLIAALLFATNLAQCLPYLQSSLLDWLDQPTSLRWFLNFYWFAMFTFVWIPLSILLGGRGRTSNATPHTFQLRF